MPSSDNLCKYEGNNVLLVEGTNDCHVVMALCEVYKVPETFGIYACGNDDRVLKRLNALISQANLPKKIGVMLDADGEVANRWESIKAKLRAYNYEFPDPPEPSGTIIEGNSIRPRLGIWLMPNNQTSGMLEDFCVDMMAPGSKEYVTNTVVHAQQNGFCTFKGVHFSKAVVHTYLAWQDEPGCPLGQAITKRSLQPDTKIAIVFTEWLNRLFNSPNC